MEEGKQGGMDLLLSAAGRQLDREGAATKGRQSAVLQAGRQQLDVAGKTTGSKATQRIGRVYFPFTSVL
jgi:hypothetical protein